MKPALARSYLFVPGNRPERFSKAMAAGADAIVIDLEDAVPAADKPAARGFVRETLDAWQAAGQANACAVVVRVNGPDTTWFGDDLTALASHPLLAGIMLPKAERRDDLATVRRLAHQAMAILPLVETARGMAEVSTLAACPGVQRLVFGTLDFQLDLGIDGDREELDPFRAQLVMASRLASLAPPIDGVSTVLDDAARIEDDARRARRFGFGAKLCIHPRQVAPVHQAYAWSEDELAWARRVLQAAGAGAAAQLDGKMIDTPVILKARRILGAAVPVPASMP
ncbi:HpcH/HpaI aldolase/citrate lyase family protein [Chitinasiproducens palmae]|uniref:Citrate lyase subunit beta / citryl-CoA lyase n=1 Tax=Chitinasiproducens palmae TaxID=1770053 RepID=A0A1H2PLQ3_9BURK|nr:CoA ester lyase [Chitinasiproducens palmae]SDV47392.1 citrate lyase subunit beta / citryl-CoA lyase [Chitinasiproducens palmae]